MQTIQVPKINQVDEQAQAIFQQLENTLGNVPNIYATIAYSSDTLSAYLKYSNAISKTSFNKKEAEAIKLIVSEINACEYCLAAHTAIAKLNGYTTEETLDIRKGEFKDERINTLIKTAQEVVLNKGQISLLIRDQFFAQGFSTKNLIDLIAVVNVTTFTNYIHNAMVIPIDFPAAPSLGINH